MNDARGNRRRRATNIDDSRSKFSSPPIQAEARIFALPTLPLALTLTGSDQHSDQHSHQHADQHSDAVNLHPAPTATTPVAEAIIPALQQTMNRLNDAKSFQTQAYGRSRELSLAIRSSMDMFSRFKRDVERTHSHVTNAWLKGWEIIYHFGNVVDVDSSVERHESTPTPSSSLRVYHVAEFPGSILLAVERYFYMKGITDDWRASSYYCCDPGAAASLKDDYHLFADHRARWMMNGVDTFGDMSSPADVRAHIQYAATHGRGAVFTSDLAVGGDNDYNQQEEINIVPHFGAAICALGMLRVGPDSLMFLKHFTLSTPFSMSLMALLASKFESLRLVKPATSRPMNSEIYVVGVGYRGSTQAEIERLLEWLEWAGRGDLAGHSLVDVPASFAAAHVRVQQSLIGVQIEHLRYFERAYGIIGRRDSPEMSAFIELCNHAKFRVTTEWKATIGFDLAI